MSSNIGLSFYMLRLNPKRFVLGPMLQVREDPMWSSLTAQERLAAENRAESLRFCNVKIKFPLDQEETIFFEDSVAFDLFSPLAQSPSEFATSNGERFGLSNEKRAKLAGSIRAQIDRHLEKVSKFNAPMKVSTPKKFSALEKNPNEKKTALVIKNPLKAKSSSVQVENGDSENVVSKEEMQAYVERKRIQQSNLKKPAEHMPNVSCHICHYSRAHGFSNCPLNLKSHTYCTKHIQQRYGFSHEQILENPEIWKECPACTLICICSACTARLRKEAQQDRLEHPQFYASVTVQPCTNNTDDANRNVEPDVVLHPPPEEVKVQTGENIENTEENHIGDAVALVTKRTRSDAESVDDTNSIKETKVEEDILDVTVAQSLKRNKLNFPAIKDKSSVPRSKRSTRGRKKRSSSPTNNLRKACTVNIATEMALNESVDERARTEPVRVYVETMPWLQRGALFELSFKSKWYHAKVVSINEKGLVASYIKYKGSTSGLQFPQDLPGIAEPRTNLLWTDIQLQA